jgi:hypothetical protein
VNIGAVISVVIVHGVEYALGGLGGGSIIKIYQVGVVFENSEMVFYT